jgi:MerR family transcriptional regulator, light-induced transcriptional regulator
MHYSIAELEQYSGIKAHTIRMWEHRYGLLSPHRTETNIRYYDDHQLRRLLNVVVLMRSGMRISLISKLSEGEFIKKLDQQLTDQINENVYAREINALIISGLTYNEEMYHRTFADCMMRYGLEKTYVDILYPVLKRAGLMWSTREMDICQRHYIRNLVRQKLFTAADHLTAPKPDAKKWVLFLPDREVNDIGLLYTNFLIRQYGNRVYYLGQRILLDDLASSIDQISPDYILTFIKHNSKTVWAQNFVNEIGELFRNCHPIVAGHPKILKSVQKPKNVSLLDNPDQLLKYIM